MISYLLSFLLLLEEANISILINFMVYQVHAYVSWQWGVLWTGEAFIIEGCPVPNCYFETGRLLLMNFRSTSCKIKTWTGGSQCLATLFLFVLLLSNVKCVIPSTSVFAFSFLCRPYGSSYGWILKWTVIQLNSSRTPLFIVGTLLNLLNRELVL
jgi:hypothetical protein